MKTSFLRILILLCAVAWSLGAQAQSAATKNETIKLIINGVEFNADRALVQAVDEPLDSVMKKFHSLEVCQNQSEDNVRYVVCDIDSLQFGNKVVYLKIPQGMKYRRQYLNDDDGLAIILNFDEASSIIISTGMFKFAVDFDEKVVNSCCSKTVKSKINNSLWRRDKHDSINLYYNITDQSKENLFDAILDEAIVISEKGNHIHPQEKLSLNSIFRGSMDDSFLVLDPSGSLIPGKKIIEDDIEYTIGLNDNKKIIYIATNDSKFTTEGLKVGDKLPEKYSDKEWVYFPGIVSYKPLDSGWCAGFDMREKPNEEICIQYFFQFSSYKDRK